MRKEELKDKIRIILYCIRELVKDKTFTETETFKEVVSSLYHNLCGNEPFEECIENFEFYNPHFDVTHIDLLPYGLYDDFAEVPEKLFNEVRIIALNVKWLFKKLEQFRQF